MDKPIRTDKYIIEIDIYEDYKDKEIEIPAPQFYNGGSRMWNIDSKNFRITKVNNE